MTINSSAWQARARAGFRRFVLKAALPDAESSRRAHLFVAFSLLGMVFGLLFTGFYFCIGHPWGAGVVLACTLALAGAPAVVRTRGLEFAGNLYAGVLVLGFTGLTAVEGGIHGHAVAWLAVVPLCACILVGQGTCRRWCAVCLGVMGVFCGLSVLGFPLPRLYPARWESVITAADYLSLTVFMSALGIAFETGRRRAFGKLQEALGALSEANARLQHLDQERGEFLGIAAHDLRAPLNAISGFAQIVQLYCPAADELQRTSLGEILTATARITELLDRLLSVRAIEEGKLEIHLAPCDLVSLAAAALESHRAAAEAKALALTFSAPPAGDAPTWARADAPALGQVLDNLLSNALQVLPARRPPRRGARARGCGGPRQPGGAGRRPGVERGGPEKALRQVRPVGRAAHRRGNLQRTRPGHRQATVQGDGRGIVLPQSARRRHDLLPVPARLSGARRGARRRATRGPRAGVGRCPDGRKRCDAVSFAPTRRSRGGALRQYGTVAVTATRCTLTSVTLFAYSPAARSLRRTRPVAGNSHW